MFRLLLFSLSHRKANQCNVCHYVMTILCETLQVHFLADRNLFVNDKKNGVAFRLTRLMMRKIFCICSSWLCFACVLLTFSRTICLISLSSPFSAALSVSPSSLGS